MIRVGDPRRYDRLAPVEKLLTLVFALVGRDRATWLRLDYEPGPPDDRVRMWYCVDAQPWEMVPPPGELWPDLVRVLWRSTRLSPADRPPWWRRARRIGFPARPVFGVLPVRYGDAVVEFDALFFRGRAGQHVWVERPRPADVAAVSEDFLRQRLRRPDDPP
jgi:hypothetical protein